MNTDMTRRSFVGLALMTPFALAACSNGATSSAPASSADTSASATTSAASATSATSSAGTEELVPGTIVNGVLISPYDNGYDSGTHHATIEVADFGTIKLELNASVAPITVSNFADLVNKGFYDGLTFHRIVEGFMIQGGDPSGTGRGGSEPMIKGEFWANGVINAIQHKRGVISMARRNDFNSGSSQFFIVQKDYPSLNEQYAAFGKVTEGMEVVDAIVAAAKVEDKNGTVLPENQPVITSIRMDD